MRLILGLLSLVAALAVVSFLARSQLAVPKASAVAVQPAGADAAGAATVPLAAQPAQVQKTVEGLMQQARPMPEDTP